MVGRGNEKCFEGVAEAIFCKRAWRKGLWMGRGMKSTEKSTKTDEKPTENDQSRHETDRKPT
jgi:hypothetical protein